MLTARDEAQGRFLQSAFELLSEVRCTPRVAGSLLIGRGSHRRRTASNQATILRHWAIVAELEALGYSDIPSDQAEGLVSMLEACDLEDALDTIARHLPIADDSAAPDTSGLVRSDRAA